MSACTRARVRRGEEEGEVVRRQRRFRDAQLYYLFGKPKVCLNKLHLGSPLEKVETLCVM